MQINCFKCIHGLNEYIQGQYFEGCMCEELISKQLAPGNYDEMIKIMECEYFEEKFM